jgi:hypothetical protein
MCYSKIPFLPSNLVVANCRGRSGRTLFGDWRWATSDRRVWRLALASTRDCCFGFQTVRVRQMKM